MQSGTRVTSKPGDEVVASFERDGFIIARDLFAREETARWKAEAQSILQGLTDEAQARGDERPGFWRSGVFVGLSIKSDVFRALGEHPRLVDVLESLIGPNVLFWSDKIVFKGEKMAYDTPWHQDYSYWKGCHKLSVWIALDDATPANGCLKLLPGSHRQAVVHDGKVRPTDSFANRLDPRNVDESKAITAAVSAGSAVIFHDLLLHASHPNSTGADRWAIISTFKDPLAEDLDYPSMTAARVVRGRGPVT